MTTFASGGLGAGGDATSLGDGLALRCSVDGTDEDKPCEDGSASVRLDGDVRLMNGGSDQVECRIDVVSNPISVHVTGKIDKKELNKLKKKQKLLTKVNKATTPPQGELPLDGESRGSSDARPGTECGGGASEARQPGDIAGGGGQAVEVDYGDLTADGQPSIYVVGDSRVRDMIGMLPVLWPGSNPVIRCRGGSMVAWTWKEAKRITERHRNAVIVIQTGVNNILNTYQNNNTIVNSFRRMLRDLVQSIPGNRIIVTSILPTDIGGSRTMDRITKVNQNLKLVVNEEGSKFIDLQELFVRSTNSQIDLDNSRPYLNRHLFQRENGCHLHLNDKGNIVFAKMLEAEMNKLKFIKYEARMDKSTYAERGREMWRLRSCQPRDSDARSVFHWERNRYRRKWMN